MNKKLKLEELKRLSISEYKKKKDPIVVVLENVRSLNNIGSILELVMQWQLKKFIYVELRSTPT